MFGGSLEPPKYYKRPKPLRKIHDIELPSVLPGCYMHLGRQPNTDYHVRILEYKQKQEDEYQRFIKEEAKRLSSEAATARYDKHAEEKYFQREVDDRVKEKLKVFDDNLKLRQAKLKQLLCNEDNQYYYETVDSVQRGAEFQMENMKKKIQQLQAQREEERLKVVQEKRLQQFKKICVEIRPVIIKRNLIETKNVQLQQMKEQQARRESERELDKMWNALLMKEEKAREELERQVALRKDQMKQDLLDTWDKQIQGKRLLQEECDRVAAEDFLEMKKLQDELRREERGALSEKMKKRDQRAKELREQIDLQSKFQAQRVEKEKALEKVFAHLSQLEVEKEQQKIKDTTSLAKKETLFYRQHLKELEKERQKEDQQFDELLEVHRKIIEKRQDEARCKLYTARMDLQRAVMEGRAEQLEEKRREAHNQFVLKQAENEMLRLQCEVNDRIQADQERVLAEADRQYRADLLKQIAGNKVIKEREQAELQRQLAEGLEEEEKYRKIFEGMVMDNVDLHAFNHPFRRVLDKRGTICPNGPTLNQ